MKLFDGTSKKWLTVLSIQFGPSSEVVKIIAYKQGGGLVTGGNGNFCMLEGEDLKAVFLVEFICLNLELFPDPDPDTAKVL